jgi:hypothetical protein
MAHGGSKTYQQHKKRQPMSDDNSPSNEENQEEKLASEQGETVNDPALVVKPESKPTDEVNQDEHKDTLPPTASHGWLDQFSAFSAEAFEELKKVASQGLVEAETDLLIYLAVKLVKLAEEHNPEALHQFTQIFTEA